MSIYTRLLLTILFVCSQSLTAKTIYNVDDSIHQERNDSKLQQNDLQQPLFPSIKFNVQEGQAPYTLHFDDHPFVRSNQGMTSILHSPHLYLYIQDKEGKDKEIEVVNKRKTLPEIINNAFIPAVEFMDHLFFFDPFSAIGLHEPAITDENGQPMIDADGKPIVRKVPFIVVWLAVGAIIFTISLRFINFRGFKHALLLVSGKLDKDKDHGEVSHFQALSTALSGTVGLGNIAGVAIAISVGGPGATFWMIVTGLLGMSMKFVECTLGVKYRRVNKDGSISGGPMYYLSEGLKKRKMKWLGLVLAMVFALLAAGNSLGGGNMFQANQSFSQLVMLFPEVSDSGPYFGVFLALLVGVVIIGGIKGIARISGKVVPFMGILYVVSALVIIFINYANIGHAFKLIIDGAFSSNAMKGGIIGVLIVGVQRAAFSNEAGIGSAAIAHSAVRTKDPITEGFVSLLEPFIDTVIICTMTALVIIFTGTYTNPQNLQGAELTSEAFASVFWWYPYILAVTIFLFAFSTMITWSYYGMQAFNYAFNFIFKRFKNGYKISSTIYQFIFLFFIVVGTSAELSAVVAFSDMMLLAMSFPNIIGLYIMRREVMRDLKVYWNKQKQLKI